MLLLVSYIDTLLTRTELSLQGCHPSSSHFLNISYLEPMIIAYDLNLEVVSSEVEVAKHTIVGKAMEDISDVLMELVPLRDAFHTIVHFLRIVLNISVTTAKCERSFSAVKTIKTYLRSSMSENRMNDLE
uniref:HAT C-terminal dimerisation domain-containing protein n=1 Tax=Amphimedon queenslandica TaxID=400682 RepID=A0A1X7URZ6_AMPQE